MSEALQERRRQQRRVVVWKEHIRLYEEFFVAVVAVATQTHNASANWRFTSWGMKEASLTQAAAKNGLDTGSALGTGE